MQNIANLISEELIYAFGWTVIHSLWQGAMVALILGVIMIPLNKKSAQLRYVISFSALISILTMAVITFATLISSGPAEEQILMVGTFESGMTEVGLSKWEALGSWFSQYFNEHLPHHRDHLVVGLAIFYSETFWRTGLHLLPEKTPCCAGYSTLAGKNAGDF
ncbi:MAG: hypothetical protein R2879_09745 [Saprospiraceae bacterium]